jgi:hypothetical protein
MSFDESTIHWLKYTTRRTQKIKEKTFNNSDLFLKMCEDEGIFMSNKKDFLRAYFYNNGYNKL